MLSYAKPSKTLYNLLVKIYIDCEDKVALGSVINGILYNKGFIKDPNNIKEILEMSKLRKIFKVNSKEQRRDILRNFENGEYENYKNRQ